MGRLTDRIGPRPIIIAGVLACVLGTVPFAFPGANGVLLAAALVVRGFGLSSANLAIMVGAYAGLTPAQIPHASSTTRIVQQLGGSFGTAVLAVLVQTQLTGHTAAVAFSHTFWWATGFAVLAFVPAIALRSSNFDRH
jgi:MFS family permease